jgi:hypothetical protein
VGHRLEQWVLVLSVLLLAGCGSSHSGSTVSVRVFQASPDAPPVNILVDGSVIASSLSYLNSSGYISVKSGSRHIQAVPVSSESAIFDQSLPLQGTSNQTLFFTGPAAAIKTVLLTDGGTKATTGDGYVRVLNASNTMGAADVYIVPAGTSIAGVAPISAALGFDKDTGYQLIAGGSYGVFLTAPGTKNAFLSTGPITLNSAQNQTVVALDGLGGGFTFVQLTNQ